MRYAVSTSHHLGLLWLDDLLWRNGKWVVHLENVHESGIGVLVRQARKEGPIAPAGPRGANVLDKVRQAYRIFSRERSRVCTCGCQTKKHDCTLKPRLCRRGNDGRRLQTEKTRANTGTMVLARLVERPMPLKAWSKGKEFGVDDPTATATILAGCESPPPRPPWGAACAGGCSGTFGTREANGWRWKIRSDEHASTCTSAGRAAGRFS